MSVTFDELENSPEITVQDGRIAARRTFLIAWDDWPDFVADLYGSHAIVSGVPTYTPPAAFPGNAALLVHDIQVEPFPPDRPLVGTLATLADGPTRYPFARVTAGYRYLPAADERWPSVPNGTILEYLSDLAAEYATMPGRFWRWRSFPDQKLPDDIAPGLLIPCEDIHLRWSRVPLPPWDAIRATRGLVNDDDFLGNAHGTVLFLGAHVEWHVFLLEALGWN